MQIVFDKATRQYEGADSSRRLIAHGRGYHVEGVQLALQPRSAMGQDESGSAPRSSWCWLSLSTISSKSTETVSTLSFSARAGIWIALGCSEVIARVDVELMPVDTSVFTTFYFGVLINKDRVLSHRERPEIQYLFRSSWGLTRRDLGIYNYAMRLDRWSHKPYDRDDPRKRVRRELLLGLADRSQRMAGLSWELSMPTSTPPPSVLLDRPLCAEVTGLGFQKLDFCDVRTCPLSS